MLEGIESIDWSKFGHAYGPATGVPDLLRGLASVDADERAEAINALCGNIWHQGTVYEASVQAVPFLVELVGTPEVEDKDQILILLAQLAMGSSYCAAHEHVMDESEGVGTPEFQARLDQELAWVRETRSAVIAGEVLYVALLAHGEPRVREAAGFLLASFECLSQKTAASVWRQFENEADPRTRASLLLSFGYLADSNDGNQSLLLNAFLHVGSDLERVAVSLAIIRHSPTSAPSDAVLHLLDVTAEPEVYAELDESPWGIHGMERLILDAFVGLQGKPGEFLRKELESRLVTATHPQALALAQVLLATAFPKALEGDATLASVSDDQRRAVSLLAANKQVWVYSVSGEMSKDPESSLLIRAYGLDYPLRKLLADAARLWNTFDRTNGPGFGTRLIRLFKKPSPTRGGV